MGKYQTIAKGVAVATVGAAVAGAIHFMFIAPQLGSQADFLPGIPNTTLIPFLLGTGLLAISYSGWGRKLGDTGKDIFKYGGAAAIGFGIASYANWVIPVGARARAYTPVMRARAFTPSTAVSATAVTGAIPKII